MALTLACPNCQCRVEWSADFPYRPFCSLRCKNEDLCAWADDKRALPGDAETDDLFTEQPGQSLRDA
jgi:endogenous inhibitor of DNA gyrase (YacG/DUF329 family)